MYLCKRYVQVNLNMSYIALYLHLYVYILYYTFVIQD